MSFPRYPAYKPSGVKWLGQIPEHWGVLQSRRMFKARREAAKEGAIMLTASQKYGMISQAEFVEREGRRVVEVIQGKDNLIQVEPDDFVISMRSFQGGLEWCRLSGSTSFHYVPITPIKHVVPSFFAHLMKSDRYISALRATTNLIRDGQEIRYSNFAQVPLPIIPESEQIALSSFLDRETAKIDALITEQQRLIELLQEKRQAVISHAVTKGLNPNAPMKDSGVEWLGEVQEHWEVKRLKDISSVIDCINKTPDYVENGEYLVVRTTNIKGRSLVLEDAKYTDELNFKIWTQRGVPRPGSIFFTREAPAGETALVPEGVPLCMGQRMMNIDTSSQALTGYILCFLQSSCLKRYIEACSMGSIVGHLRVPQVENLPLPVPPAGEQEQIARRVAKLGDTFDEVTSNLTTSINLLKERRSALISAAVTGQIDVRGLVEAEGSEK